jgi:hypothetical protein
LRERVNSLLSQKRVGPKLGLSLREGRIPLSRGLRDFGQLASDVLFRLGLHCR